MHHDLINLHTGLFGKLLPLCMLLFIIFYTFAYLMRRHCVHSCHNCILLCTSTCSCYARKLYSMQDLSTNLYPNFIFFQLMLVLNLVSGFASFVLAVVFLFYGFLIWKEYLKDRNRSDIFYMVCFIFL